MYKNFRISEDEKKQILEMHRKQGYKRAINEDEESMNPESMGSQDTSVASPESGNQGIKPDILKVIKLLAQQSFPTVREFQRHPFEKYTNAEGVTYYGEFNLKNTPDLQRNQNVKYESIIDASIQFTIRPTGINAGIYGEVRLNTFTYTSTISANEINKYSATDLHSQVTDGAKTPGGLISELGQQYGGIQNGVGKQELLQRLKNKGFKER